MRIYIAGPMTGYPEFNFPAFHAAATMLRSLGFDVVNPAEVVTDTSTPWEECMKRDIQAMLSCDSVATLDGWERSKGAGIETSLARQLSMPVKPLGAWLEAR